jgi:hypothetical protein
MKVEDMDKKKFLVTMLAAVVTALILVLIQRGPKENTPVTTPAPKGTPAPQVSLPAATDQPNLQPGTCAPTECRFSPVITPAFDETVGEKHIVGIWNMPRSASSTLVLKNVSTETITVSAVTLSMCLNDSIVPLASVPAECQFLKITQCDYTRGTLELKPNATLTTTLTADTHGQVAKLQFDTTRGPVIVLVTVQ